MKRGGRRPGQKTGFTYRGDALGDAIATAAHPKLFHIPPHLQSPAIQLRLRAIREAKQKQRALYIISPA